MRRECIHTYETKVCAVVVLRCSAVQLLARIAHEGEFTQCFSDFQFHLLTGEEFGQMLFTYGNSCTCAHININCPV